MNRATFRRLVVVVILSVIVGVVFIKSEGRKYTLTPVSGASEGLTDQKFTGTDLHSFCPRTFAQDVNSEQKETPPAASNAFLGFLDIREQLSSNTFKFLQLSYVSAVWNLSMVEPRIDVSSARMSNLPPVKRPQILLFDLYNKTAVEKSLTKCFNSNLPKESQMKFVFHTLNEALIHSPRDVLIVTFKSTKWTDTMGNGECDSISSEEKKNVLNVLNHHVQRVKDEAQKIHGQDFTFKIWRTVCITAVRGVPFSMKNATIFIQQQLVDKQRGTNRSATVVLPNWTEIKSINPHHYYYDPNFQFNETFCQLVGLPHSCKVLIAAERMMERNGFSERFIAVYARTERIVRDKGKAWKQCLNKLPELLKNVTKISKIPRTRVVLVHDAGKYGSNTIDYLIRRESHKILESLKLRPVQYDPNLNKDLPQNRMFVAAVEQEFLSQSHILVTLGRGGFVINTKQRFISRQAVERVYSLCDY